MAKFLIIPNDGDRFDFTGYELFETTLTEEIKTGIADCIRSGVNYAYATIGHVKQPVRGANSGETLVYEGEDRSWEAVKKWVKQIEEEESSVLCAPNEWGCCLVILVIVVLPLVLFIKYGGGPSILAFLQLVWIVVSSFFRALWTFLTTGRL